MYLNRLGLYKYLTYRIDLIIYSSHIFSGVAAIT